MIAFVKESFAFASLAAFSTSALFWLDALTKLS